VLGYETTELFGKSIFAHMHPDDTPAAMAEFKRAITTFSSGQAVHRYRHKNGEWRWLESTGKPFRTATGEIRAVIVSRDITDRKRAEDVLSESLAQLSKKSRYEAIIGSVTRSVHQSINLQDVLENAVEAMSKNMDKLENVVIFLVEGEEAVLKAYRGYPDWYIERVRRIPYPRGATWKTIIEGKPRYVADTDTDTALGPAGREVGTKSYLSMPIHSGGKTIGCIHIHSFQKNAFDGEELKLVEIVAQQIEVAINNARQAEALRQSEERYRKAKDKLEIKVRDLEILTGLIQAVHKSSDLEEIYKVALDSVVELENVDLAMIYLIDEEKHEAVLHAHRNLTEDYIRRAGRIPYPKGLTWKAINSGRIINIEDAQKDPDTGPAGRDLGHHSNLGIPVIIEGKVIGVIWFGSYKERKFKENEVNLLSTLGDQIAIAIARAKQTSELEERSRKLSILSMISQAVHKSVDLNQIYKTLLDITNDLKFIDLMAVYLVEGEGDKREAVLQIDKGYPEEYLKKFISRIPYSIGLTWKIITSGEPVFYGDASDPSTPVGPVGKALGQRSLLSIPIKSGSETIGVIHFSSSERTSFSQQEIDFLLSLGSQIGTAIAKAKMFEEIKQREEVLRESFAQLSKKNRYETIISTVTRSVHRSINLQDVLKNAVEAMGENIDGADNVSIYLVEGEEAVLKAYWGYPEWFIKKVGRIPYPKGFTWKTIIDRKSRYCADAEQDTFIGPAGREMGTKSYASMPINHGDKTVGTLNLASFQKNAFDEEELKLLGIVAQQIEIVINNARQAEELQKAKEELELRVYDRTKELIDINKELTREIMERKRAEETLRKRTEQVLRYQRVLLKLAKMDNSDLHSALKKITEADAKTLGVERVSVWHYSEDRSEIICKDLYKLSENIHESGLRLKTQDYPNYFLALEESRILAANDARLHPCTQEYTEGYLKPLGITSMMDVPVRVHGEVVGIIGHEHTGFMREWTVEEQDFAASIADMVSLALEASERRLAEEQIKASLKEKEVLLKEIHHRVKNNLQIIHSLLNLQSIRIDDSRMREKLKQSQNRIKSMALIHETLYQSKDFARIDFREYIKELSTHLFSSYGADSKNIKLSIDADNVFLSIDKAIPCSLIINEIVSNALKHGFLVKKKGKIRITLHSNSKGSYGKDNTTPHLCRLIISNNGIKFPEDLDFRNTESVGLQLVCALTEQLKGTIELDKSTGTEFKITFPA